MLFDAVLSDKPRKCATRKLVIKYFKYQLKWFVFSELTNMVRITSLALLVEHAARLKDFLPKGVLASGEDLDLINTVSSKLETMSMNGTSRAGTRAAGSKAFAM